MGIFRLWRRQSDAYCVHALNCKTKALSLLKNVLRAFRLLRNLIFSVIPLCKEFNRMSLSFVTVSNSYWPISEQAYWKTVFDIALQCSLSYCFCQHWQFARPRDLLFICPFFGPEQCGNSRQCWLVCRQLLQKFFELCLVHPSMQGTAAKFWLRFFPSF